AVDAGAVVADDGRCHAAVPERRVQRARSARRTRCGHEHGQCHACDQHEPQPALPTPVAQRSSLITEVMTEVNGGRSSPDSRERTLRHVDVLTPRTLDEALSLKAEHPDAVPIQGGTDVMVALNFDRARPEQVLNLNEVAELRGYTRENGTLRLGSGL